MKRRNFLSLIIGTLGVYPFGSKNALASKLKNQKSRMDKKIEQPEMVLCIPGPWADRSELIKNIVEKSGGFIFAGRILMHMESKFSCELIHENADPSMLGAFHAAGPHWKDNPAMQAIAGYKSVVYLVGKGGSRENAENMMQAAAGLIKAGGLGVKVESAGIAHAPGKWLYFTENLHLFSAHEALVIYVTGKEIYSCGMHNLGLRDAIIDGGNDKEVVELLRIFSRYLFTESPVLCEGETFSINASARKYRLKNDSGVRYEERSLFNNPYEAWRLMPASPE